jgi:hypothetical protein
MNRVTPSAAVPSPRQQAKAKPQNEKQYCPLNGDKTGSDRQMNNFERSQERVTANARQESSRGDGDGDESSRSHGPLDN